MLLHPHLRIYAVFRQQLRVRATLNNAPIVHHQNLFGINDGGQAVRDDECGAVLRSFIKRRLNGFLGVGIERGGGFIKYQYRGIFL